MDGFDATNNVKIIAATNRIDLLDPALLRPGRFDRVIEVPLPDEQGRTEIFKIHTRKMKLAPDVDIESIAKMTASLSGADIKVITKEAGMFVLRRRGTEITMKDLTDAYDKVVSEEENNIPHGMFA
jgi:proteasome regulatory subunit